MGTGIEYLQLTMEYTRKAIKIFGLDEESYHKTYNRMSTNLTICDIDNSFLRLGKIINNAHWLCPS